MTDPHDSNDDWAELAREFALDKPAREEPAEPAPRPESEGDADAAPEAAETEAEDEFEDSDEATAGEPGAEGDGPGGAGRKRRRRRRRRRKGGAPGEAAVTVGPDDGGEEAEAADEPAEVEPVAEADDSDAAPRDESEDDFDAEPALAPAGIEEDTANDVLRELIATWNVPSWDSIVSGLYRPN